MNYNNYLNYISSETLMGPSCVRILEELLKMQPLQLNKGNVVLDLGCGKGLTSLIIAKETGASVVANDLWISEEDNRKRFDEWGVGERITPARRDANDLAFESAQFDALFSVDAYHYFATEQGFFEDKILPFLKNGAVVLIGVPGIKKEYTGRAEELLPEWLGDEAYMFKSTSEWREIIGKHVVTVEQQNVLSVCSLNASPARSPGTNVFFVAQHGYSRIGNTVEDFACRVGRAVLDNYNLNIPVRLSAHRRYTLLYPLFYVVCRYYNTYHRVMRS